MRVEEGGEGEGEFFIEIFFFFFLSFQKCCAHILPQGLVLISHRYIDNDIIIFTRDLKTFYSRPISIFHVYEIATVSGGTRIFFSARAKKEVKQ